MNLLDSDQEEAVTFQIEFCYFGYCYRFEKYSKNFAF